MTKEHAEVETRLRNENEGKEKMWEKKYGEQGRLLKTSEKDVEKERGVVMGLRKEVEMLNRALVEEKEEQEAKTQSLISNLTGQINTLQQNIIMEEQRRITIDNTNTELVKFLQGELVNSHYERRRLHNVIQQLRGNVRVFARIRPFLPGDNVSEDTVPNVLSLSEKSLKISSDDPTNPAEHSFQL